MINRAKLQHILEYTKQQRHIGLHCKIPPEDMVEILEMAMLQGAEPVTTANKLPEGWVAVPKRLTAENGAKAALIGEFNLEYSLTCHECFGEGCEDCNGAGTWTNSVPIDWTTIKDIWAKAIDHFAAAPQQEVKS